MRNVILPLIFAFFYGTTFSQTGTASLSIEEIMQGEQFIGYAPDRIFWSDDSNTIYFNWNPEQEPQSTLYKVRVGGENEPEKVSLDEQRKLIRYPIYNNNYTKVIYTIQGDVFLKDYLTKEVLQITQTVARESNPSFSQNEDRIIYQSGNNLYAWNIHSGQTTQLTDFRTGSAKEKREPQGQAARLHEEEMELFEVLRKRRREKDFSKQIEESLKTIRPLPIYLKGKRLSNINISPDLHFVTYRLTQPADATGTKIPHFITESGYTKVKKSRSKVGAPQDKYEFGVYDIWKDTTYLLDVTQIEGIYDLPKYLDDYPEIKKTMPENKPRALIIHDPIYSSKGNAVVVARAMDNKDRWILQLDMNTGELTTIDRQHDDAWIGGPGISGWNFSSGNIGWLPDGETLWYQSEKTGYSHLYTWNISTHKKKQLTKGKYEILSVQLSRDGQYFFIQSNKESPFDIHFYKMPVKGGKMQRITDGTGNFDVYLSPNEEHLAVRYSTSNRPWELYLMPNKPGAKMQQLTHSTTPKFEAYPWRKPEITYFEASDGVKVPARIYRPKGEASNGAGIIFVHGAGYLQNVHHWWSGYFREYMFHNFLVDHGYTVLDIDYRASKGYGRDWRTAIYRYMGGKDLSDQVDGAKYLVTQGIDANRIGIYGGSYGGFITLMALFNHPGTFRCGAAIRSVTDWAHYNHPYTSNILNTPDLDSIAYRRSSPIYFAEGLQDHLLILHGMVDDNVHFQDVVRLSQRLIELRKDNWEMAAFPVERHGFVEPSSWTDEYKRIFRLFEEYLLK